MTVVSTTTIETSSEGPVPPGAIERAVEHVRGAAARCREPVHHIEVRVGVGQNPAMHRPARAEATVSVNGTPVRAHVGAATVAEAVDDLVDRLRRRLDEHEDRLHRISERYRTGDSRPGAWHHGDRPAPGPSWVELPVEEREVRRRKTFAMEPMSLDEAAFDLVQLDHDFYLFVDLASGADAVISHGDDGALMVQRATGTGPTDDGPGVVRVTTIEALPPVLAEVEAREHLEATGAPWLFFVSARSGRGQVLYRRYDGHYGLVGPA